MIRIGICDDEKEVRENLRVIVEKYFKNKEIQYEFFEKFFG